MRYKKLEKKLKIIDVDFLKREVVADDEQKTCSYCLTKIDCLALFCPYCNAFQSDMDYRICERCDKVTEIDSIYCRHCGQPSIIY